MEKGGATPYQAGGYDVMTEQCTVTWLKAKLEED